MAKIQVQAYVNPYYYQNPKSPKYVIVHKDEEGVTHTPIRAYVNISRIGKEYITVDIDLDEYKKYLIKQVEKSNKKKAEAMEEVNADSDMKNVNDTIDDLASLL